MLELWRSAASGKHRSAETKGPCQLTNGACCRYLAKEAMDAPPPTATAAAGGEAAVPPAVSGSAAERLQTALGHETDTETDERNLAKTDL